MTDDAIYEQLEALRVETEAALNALQATLQQQADNATAEHRQKRDALLAAHGKTPCPKCDGTGAIERLDSGYMRRFGLREWDGCEGCGGRLEQRGMGFLPNDRPVPVPDEDDMNPAWYAKPE